MRIGIAGSGRVAKALGRSLGAAVVGSRSLDHAREAAEFMGSAEAVPLEELVCDRLIIAVSDKAIRAVAAQVPVPRVALHTSGAHGKELLEALRRAGTSCGALHPLQTFGSAASGFAALRGSAFAVDGDVDALAWAEEIAGSLDGTILRVPGSARALYHAAAVLASNAVVATLDAGIEVLGEIGISSSQARAALAPIARAALENTLALGGCAALTGPVERNDRETLERHLDALTQVSPSIRELYRAAGVHCVGLASQRGLDREAAQILQEMLSH